MADLPASLKDWSLTEGANEPAGTRSIGNLDNNLRRIQTVIREEVATSDTLASASTTDLGSVDAHVLNITGTTTITSLGTVSAGIRRKVWFTGALTLTHNGTSLILPTGSNITTAAGDSAEFLSLGSGNWRCLWFQRASAVLPASLSTGLFLTNNGTTTSWATPAASLSSLTAATGTNTLANGAFTQTWNWSGQNTNDSNAFVLTSTATSGSGQSVLRVSAAGNVSRAATFIGDVYFGTQTAITGSGVVRTAPVDQATIDSQGFTLYGQSATGTSPARNAGASIIAGGTSTAGTGGDVTISPGTGSPGGRLTLRNSDSRVQMLFDASTANISSGGGAGATIRGTDHFFEVTFGTGSPTSVVVGFDNALPAAPMCVLSGTQAGQVLTYSASTTGVTISSGTAFSSGTKVTCIVIVAS
ncbi:MAG: hypothetical protein ACK52I_37435 [Pseudomonadota bacterium]